MILILCAFCHSAQKVIRFSESPSLNLWKFLNFAMQWQVFSSYSSLEVVISNHKWGLSHFACAMFLIMVVHLSCQVLAFNWDPLVISFWFCLFCAHTDVFEFAGMKILQWYNSSTNCYAHTFYQHNYCQVIYFSI